MENIIDIQLVKEQLRLLGHNVADEVILEFVKGLNRGAGEVCLALGVRCTHSTHAMHLLLCDALAAIMWPCLLVCLHRYPASPRTSWQARSSWSSGV